MRKITKEIISYMHGLGCPGVGDFYLSGNPPAVYGGLTSTVSTSYYIMREVKIGIIPATYRFKEAV